MQGVRASLGSETSRGFSAPRPSRLPGSSLRLKLILLVLLGAVPPLVMMLVTTVVTLRHEDAEARATALRLVREASAVHTRFPIETRDMLSDLAQLPIAFEGEAASCTKVLQGFLRERSGYESLAVARPSGEIRCSAFPRTEPSDISDQTPFRRALETRSFAFGDCLIDRAARKATIGFALPVLDSTGRVRDVLFAARDLTLFGDMALEGVFPAGTTITVFDGDGTIVARHPDSRTWVGRSLPHSPQLEAILGQNREGTAEGTCLGGVPCLFAFRPLDRHPGMRALYVSVGIPSTVAFSYSDAIRTSDVVALGLASVLALVGGWIAGEVLLLRRVRSLVDATQHLSAGDLSARTHGPAGNDELGVLARAFDEMAAALESREQAILGKNEELGALERRFRAVVENSSDGIVFLRADRTFVYASPSTSRILGYGSDELIGRDALELVHGEDQDRAAAQLSELLRVPGGMVGTKVRCQHKDGSVRWVESIASNLLDEPSVRSIVCNFRDFTDRKVAEEELEESQARLAGIVGSAMDAIITIDAGQRIVLFNAAAERMFGCSAEEATGSSIDRFIPPSAREPHRQHIRRFADTGATRRVMGSLGALRARHASGDEFPIEASISKVEVNGRRLFTVILRDVTERLRAEAALRDNEAELRRARDELEERVEQRTADLARTNAALRAEVTERRRAEETLRRLNQELEEQARRLAQTLHDEAGQFLTAAHIALVEADRDLPPSARPPLREVKGHLDRIEEQLRRLAHELRPRILDDLGLVPALEFLAEGVAKRHGISIAVKASLSRRLPATVETTLYRLSQEALTNVSRHAQASRVCIRLEEQPTALGCAIVDDGVGFDVAAVLAAEGRGGLGLIGIRDRLRALGGTLRIDSRPGQGTEVAVTVPLEA